MAPGVQSHGAAAVQEEIAGFVKLYSDGGIVRTDDPAMHIPPSEEDRTRDVVLDDNAGLWVRLYLPPPHTPNHNLPVVLYFHGGGFCCFSPAFLFFHRFCLKWADAMGAIIVSVNYRLAPEHRLPAAYGDSIAALEWLRSQSIKKLKGGEEADPWFDSRADFSNVFLMGDSAGGNIAHHVGAYAAGMKWAELCVRGIVLVQPFFGGQERRESEIESREGAFLSLEASDKYWRLALPVGADRDHPFCNPMGLESPSVAGAALPPMLVLIGGGDILRDRQLEYVDGLKRIGKHVEVVVFEEEEHAFYCLKLEDQSSLKAMQCASQFIRSNLANN